jgi:hypothetical protein
VRRAGVPVFRSCDQAIRSLGRYLCHRAKSEPPQAPENVASKRERRPEPVAVLT